MASLVVSSAQTPAPRRDRAATRLSERFLASHISMARRTLGNLIFAVSGAPAWRFARLRSGHAAACGVPDAHDEAAYDRHLIPLAGLRV